VCGHFLGLSQISRGTVHADHSAVLGGVHAQATRGALKGCRCSAMAIVGHLRNAGSFSPTHRKTPKTVWCSGRWRSASNEPTSTSDCANLHTSLLHIH
jgi:hypothetical protein